MCINADNPDSSVNKISLSFKSSLPKLEKKKLSNCVDQMVNKFGSKIIYKPL